MADTEQNTNRALVIAALVDQAEKYELLRVQICTRLQKDPDLCRWEEIGFALARDTPEGKRIFPPRKGRKPKSSGEYVTNVRAKLTDLVKQDYPDLTTAEVLRLLKDHVKGNPERERWFLSDLKTLTESVSRGRTKLQKKQR